jgi:histidyl-tRNA synthetase
LAKPTKWFWQQNCFRAERPQRGRLREFLQWNVDLIGGDETAEGKAAADAEVIGCVVAMLEQLGLTPQDAVIAYSNRQYIETTLQETFRIAEGSMPAMFKLLDEAAKLEPSEFDRRGAQLGVEGEQREFFSWFAGVRALEGRERWRTDSDLLGPLESALRDVGASAWCDFRPGVVRGLAYYTGTVFEILAKGERAIAGGGRYDGLVEMFGGPATPAVGFGLGDVVLSNLLADRGLMPEGRELMERLSRPSASYRPDVFVLGNGTEEAEGQVRGLVARLRRGGEDGWAPLHARHSYKSTKNIGKLLKEASDCFSRFAVIVESAERVTLKNLDTREEVKEVPIGEVGTRVHASMNK